MIMIMVFQIKGECLVPVICNSITFIISLFLTLCFSLVTDCEFGWGNEFEN